jgi:hypothetical protein
VNTAAETNLRDVLKELRDLAESWTSKYYASGDEGALTRNDCADDLRDVINRIEKEICQ